MSSISSTNSEAARHRRQLKSDIRDALRNLNIQLSLLNRQVGARLDLKDGDLGCLDLIARHGPMSPSALARRAGLHPATVTGILDRLERDGWITRDRHPEDRRGVAVSALHTRNAEVVRLYAGMTTALNHIVDDYTDAELAVLADFLRRATEAGQRAAGDLAGS